MIEVDGERDRGKERNSERVDANSVFSFQIFDSRRLYKVKPKNRSHHISGHGEPVNNKTVVSMV